MGSPPSRTFTFAPPERTEAEIAQGRRDAARQVARFRSARSLTLTVYDYERQQSMTYRIPLASRRLPCVSVGRQHGRRESHRMRSGHRRSSTPSRAGPDDPADPEPAPSHPRRGWQHIAEAVA